MKKAVSVHQIFFDLHRNLQSFACKHHGGLDHMRIKVVFSLRILSC